MITGSSRLPTWRARTPAQVPSRVAADDTYGSVITLSGSLIPRSLSVLRWAILGATLAITVVWPFSTRPHYPLWTFVVGALLYNLAIEVLRRRTRLFASFAAIALLDLPVAALAYTFDEAPGGPLFVVFFLGVISAGMSLSSLNAGCYVATAVGIATLIAPTLPEWEGSESDFRRLSSRLLILVLAGVGTAIMRRQLLMERARSEQIRETALQLHELDQLRTEFVEMVSHDLQTPLTSARAGLGMLAQQVEGRLEGPERSLLNNVRRNVDRLGIQIDNLLLLNHLDSGTLQPELALVDLRHPVQAAVASVRLLTREKRQKLLVLLPTPLAVYGDAQMLEQLIVNLLANAHRHTPHGTVIQVMGELRGDCVALVVRDNGPGIAGDDLQHIFQRYFRSRQVGGGSGLGLAIVESFATLHHGQVHVESQLACGTTFTVILPLADADLDDLDAEAERDW